MSDNATTPRNTRGGLSGHIFRRFIHVGMIAIPILYYYWGVIVAAWFDLTPKVFVSIVLVLILVGEFIRIKKRLLIFGQRQHEATHLSSFGWSVVAISLVLIFAPSPIYAIPLVGSCAFGDPLVGEFKKVMPWWCAALMTAVIVSLMWFVFQLVMPELSSWYVWLIGVVVVLVEKPSFRWVDDNALMQLVPLLILWIAY